MIGFASPYFNGVAAPSQDKESTIKFAMSVSGRSLEKCLTSVGERECLKVQLTQVQRTVPSKLEVWRNMRS